MFNSGFKTRAGFEISRFGREFNSLIKDMNWVLSRIVQEHGHIANDRHFS